MNKQIVVWLKQEGLSPQVISSTHVRLYLKHAVGKFALDIINQGTFTTLGADLMPDVEGKRRDEFLAHVLTVNTDINAPKVSMHEGRFVLVRETWTNRLGKTDVLLELNQFRRVHEFAMRELPKEAKNMGLRFVRAK